MFALVKKIFGKSPAAPAALQPRVPAVNPFAVKRPPATRPAPAAAPAAAPAPALAPRSSSSATPEPPVAAPARKPAPVVTEFSKETVDLPLKQLWAKLNPEVVQSAVASPKGDALLRLPLNLVHAHLATGSMKIPFAQFRQFSPEGFFNGQAPNDLTEVAIPIGAILAKLKPEQLPRRSGQKKIQVPDEIEPIFGGKKGNLRIVTEKSKPAPATNASTAAATAAPVTPTPAASVQPISPIVPDQNTDIPPARTLPRAQEEPVSNEPLRAPKLDPSLATLRPSVPVPAPVRNGETFAVALMDLATHWAEQGKRQLEDLYRHSLEIPMSVLESALKKGKVEFLWREVRPWVRLASGNTLPTIDDDTKVDFPLSWIAPRFLEQQHKAEPRTRVEVGEDIPNVFVRHASAQPRPLVHPAPQPAADLAKKGPREFGEIFGQPEKKEWSLGEVGQRTTTLPGVAGAIIATSDGLLVGGKWPGTECETVAAFVPQMFNRMASYTKELKLGEPGNFTLLIENVPLRIFKSADSYFTVLGRAGESLPTQELNAIASRLAASLTEN